MILSRITFPGVGISLDPPTVAFRLGGLTVYWYGIILATGFLLGVLYCLKRSKEFGITEDQILDGLFIVAPVAIICARIYYCIFNWSEYADNPISCLYIWEGGIAIYGSLIGAILMTIVYTRWKKLPLKPILDLVSLGFVIGQFIGRWGNFIKREADGAAHLPAQQKAGSRQAVCESDGGKRRRTRKRYEKLRNCSQSCRQIPTILFFSVV